MVNNDDEKYKNVIDSLKGLQKVNAPANFDANLMRRINSLEPEKKESFWERFFVPSKLIPATALAISAVILLFVLNANSNNEDPLLTNPRVRTDIISLDDISGLELSPDQSTTGNQTEKSKGTNEGMLKEQKTYSDSDQKNPASSSSDFEYSIDKKGLNFRQVNISKEERESVSRVKSHFLKIMESGKNNWF